MPCILLEEDYKFYIYLNENSNEPTHVHVLNADAKGEAKIWLPANTEKIAYSHKISRHDLRKIMRIVKKNQKFLRNKYQELSSGTKKEKVQPTILKLKCDKNNLAIQLSDGRNITIPTGWHEVLREASLEQLKSVQITPSGQGIYWKSLEEFLSINSFTSGLNANCQ